MTHDELAALQQQYPAAWVKLVIRDDWAEKWYHALALYWGVELKPWEQVPFATKEWLREAMSEMFESAESIARVCQKVSVSAGVPPDPRRAETPSVRVPSPQPKYFDLAVSVTRSHFTALAGGKAALMAKADLDGGRE